jgi:hypothetical protein
LLKSPLLPFAFGRVAGQKPRRRSVWPGELSGFNIALEPTATVLSVSTNK